MFKSYEDAGKHAQSLADSTGYDHGVEFNPLFKTWRVWMLPMKKNRYGHELRCEVRMCSTLEKTQTGHGCKA